MSHKLTNIYLDEVFIPGIPVCPDCGIEGTIEKQTDTLVAGRYALGIPTPPKINHWLFKCPASGLLYIVIEQTHFAVCPSCKGKKYYVSVDFGGTVEHAMTYVCAICSGRGWLRL